jgi:hypothetical protein
MLLEYVLNFESESNLLDWTPNPIVSILSSAMIKSDSAGNEGKDARPVVKHGKAVWKI